MPKTLPLGLTKTPKGYCRTIGYYLKGDGKRVPKKFYLGHDRRAALKKMQMLTEAWENVPGERGEKVWTDEAVVAALGQLASMTIQSAIVEPAVAVPVIAAKPMPVSQPFRVFTLPDALDEFNAYFGARSDISDIYRRCTQSRIDSIKLHLAEIFVANADSTQTWLKDLPLAAVDMEWMARIRNKITDRPATKHDFKTPKPISIDCVKNWMMSLAMAFDWFDRTPRVGWVVPHARWRENFIITKKQEYALRTPEERDNEGKPKPAFTVDELTQIYKASTTLGRKYLLMGLTLGWAQEGISSFRRPQFVEIDGQYFIDRRRGKTGEKGYWWVCPELAQLLIRSMAETPANVDDLAFLTEDGLPLVHGKTDTIRLTWDRSLNCAPKTVRKLPFGRVKKCGAQIIQNLSSHELAQLFLAHKSQTVAALNYVGADVSVGIGKNPFEKLHDVQREMWKQLKPLFDAVSARRKPSVANSITSSSATEAA